MNNDKILLESGTNEVEILEFQLGEQSFGVNVLKIQAIEQFDDSRLTTIQLAPKPVAGSLLFRDECLTLIDLGVCLEVREKAIRSSTEDDQLLVLVMEFNNIRTSFLVDGVDRIHRVSWGSITPLSSFLNLTATKFTGSLNINNREILLVDMEKVVAEVLPGDMERLLVTPESDADLRAARGAIPIFLAEDSPTIRELLAKELTLGGYTNLKIFPNGAECLEAVHELHQQARTANTTISAYISGIITDIEMPKLDGLALCKTCREDLGMDDTPIIMFSSMINEQMAIKCQEVGATDYLSKPQFGELVAYLDRHCLQEPATV